MTTNASTDCTTDCTTSASHGSGSGSPLAPYLGGGGDHWDVSENIIVATGAKHWTGRHSGYTFTQNTGSKQPTRSDSDTVFGDEYSLDFNRGATQFMECTDAKLIAAMEGAHSIGILIEVAADGVAQPVISYGTLASPSNYEWFGVDTLERPTFARRNPSNVELSGTALSGGDVRYMVAIWDHAGNVATIRVNGSVDAGPTANAQDPTGTGVRLGRIAWSSSTSNYFNSKVRHIVVGDHMWDADEIAGVESYLADFLP